jgi:hypothetical protein
LKRRGFWLDDDLETNHGDRIEKCLFRYRSGTMRFGEQDLRNFHSDRSGWPES